MCSLFNNSSVESESEEAVIGGAARCEEGEGEPGMW